MINNISKYNCLYISRVLGISIRLIPTFIIILVASHNVVKAQIEIVESPVELSRYTIGTASPTTYLILNKLNEEYFITYRDLVIKDNYNTLKLGDIETALQFRKLIINALDVNDFIKENAQQGDTKEIDFIMNEQTIRLVREYGKKRYSEILDRELPHRVSVRLFINYGAYSGSTFNGSKDAWEEVLKPLK